MSDGRNRFRDHVRAAREWLGQAEHSLDNKEDIRGDLNVMLAQAELQRAKETKEPTRRQRWLYRLVPAAAAVVMVAGGWLFWQWRQPRPAAPLQPPVIMTVPSVSAAAQPATATQPATTMQPALQAEAAPPAAMPVEQQPKSPELPAIAQEPAEPAAAPAVTPAPVEKQAVYMPSENLQKLMCSAGKSLRAQ